MDALSGATREELADALRAVREAIGLPHPATAGDHEKRTEIIATRTMDAMIFLNHILDEEYDHSHGDVARSAAYLRERLAESPYEGRYKTWDERQAELAAAKQTCRG